MICYLHANKFFFLLIIIVTILIIFTKYFLNQNTKTKQNRTPVSIIEHNLFNPLFPSLSHTHTQQIVNIWLVRMNMNLQDLETNLQNAFSTFAHWNQIHMIASACDPVLSILLSFFLFFQILKKKIKNCATTFSLMKSH